jgi:hypothetical protein
MSIANPTGIPRLEREEPELATEEDIPTPSNDDPAEMERNTEVHGREGEPAGSHGAPGTPRNGDA